VTSALHAAPARTWSLAALIGALAMLGPFAIDMYLPAFAAIGRDLDAAPLAVQQTLSIYLAAFAFMMLWHGALADALGRRPVVLAALSVYALASLGAAIAGNVESLWLFRALQGLSAGAGMVVGRAVIRDRFHGAEAQRLMSQVTLVFSIAPAIAPVIGGVLLNLLGWRSIFWVMLLQAVLLILWVHRKLPETLARNLRQPLSPPVLFANYRHVVMRPEFLLLALVPAFNFAAFFLYIAAAPQFLVVHLGVSTYGFAWLFVPMISGVLIGALISGRSAGRRSPQRTIRLGFATMFAGCALNVAITAFVPPSVPWHVLPIFVFTIGSATVMPSITLLLLDLFPANRGLASSLQGFVQFGLSAANAALIAPLLATSLALLAAGMIGFTLASFATWLIYQRRARTLLRDWTPT
jgi:DHA1 family bicyclomycin/chloramphenicol resistance-like MFS transporter